MERAWRRAQNTRMDSARSTSICRRFINGSCRLGSRCKYRHEWPVTPSAQICRYFQKGGCWYGEYCRYLHVIQPEGDAAVASRRSSVPTVSSSSVSYVQPDRRGSVPALLQAEMMSRQECSRSESVVNVPNPQRNTEQLAANIAEDQSQGLAQSSQNVQAQVCDEGNEQEMSSSETTDEGAAAAAAAAAAATVTSSTQGKVDKMEAIRQSKNVTCGICMDKVYEKMDPKNHVFGILPNCNHSFCLQCIMTWRKTKDFGLDVVKSCPQCRVRSAFYVPNKYWVEGQAKENVIAAFKEKLSKKSCGYFSRYGGCPFKAECLYRHDSHARNTSFPYPTEDEDDDYYDGVDLLNLFIAMTLLGSGGDYDDDDDDDDDDEDFDFAFYLSGEYGF